MLNRSAVVLADHDDPDVPALLEHLRTHEVGVVWLRLGRDASEYDVEVGIDDALLRDRTTCLDTDAIRAAGVVLHRRWRLSPPIAPVLFRADHAHAGFGAREWASTIETVLAHWYDATAKTVAWGNPPVCRLEKLTLLRLARDSGFEVPDTTVATRHRALSSSVVTKAISHDEHVGDGMYFPTTILGRDVVERLERGRNPCPTLVQQKIHADYEVRLVHAFGAVAAVRIERRRDDPGPVDIRYADAARKTAWPVPESVLACTERLARRSGLAVFTVDLLARGARMHLVDVTPEGCLGGFDDPDGTLVRCLASGMERQAHATPV